MAQPKEVQQRIKDVRAARKMLEQAQERLFDVLGEPDDDESPPDFEMNGFFASEQQRRAREAAHFGRPKDEELG